MEQKIDIDRLIVALYENVRNEEQYRWLDGAMKDLELSGNGGKIVEINSEKVEPSKIEAGKWYMCTKTTSSEDDRVWFKHGELYKGEDILRCDMGFEAKDYKDYFRPATEEEIQREKGLTYDPVNQVYYKVYKHGDEIIKSATEEEIPHNTIKFDNVPETDFGKEEKLTEFEKTLKTIIDDFVDDFGRDGEHLDYGSTVQYAQELLSIASKQIASEVDVKKMLVSYKARVRFTSTDEQIGYTRGIEDTLKAIAGKEANV